MKKTIQFRLNGDSRNLTVETGRALLWVLRTELGLTGCKYGCGEGHCGACTVLVSGEALRSCLIPVEQIDGEEVITIEGLANNGDLHPLQKAFMEHDALQCGFCTPGMILTAYALLLNKKRPSRDEIVNHMDENLCRCGSHGRIIEAIQTAALEMHGGQVR